MKRFVIGIESTAHTFSSSIVASDGEILSNSKEVYKPPAGSGIHPFEASQSHRDSAARVVAQSLEEAGVAGTELSAVSYAMGPGLGPCLRVGALVARTLAAKYSIPLVPVNHAVGHIELGCLLTGTVDPLVLLVSGGHSLIVVYAAKRWRILGETLDLTLGQLLDQFGRHAGLASPCGAKVEVAASKSRNYQELPYTVKGNDVSFSGLLTSAKRMLDGRVPFEDVCFSLQETAFAMMVEVTERALAFTQKREVMVVGGVSANRRLSSMITEMSGRHGSEFSSVPLSYSGDCGAQIAWTGMLADSAGVKVPVESAGVRQSWRLDTAEIPWRD
ncbi:MAG TPA: KEOPS complex N(6)-L-threonylcarbamoyladenine synthase Kae1 [Nitrososphaerales archaeon]|nr:KEOPS complex N(6)-L-threonylcarbamoyladenine synthase Kae1 [Nitrososphaerales archaeon]